MTLRLGLLGGTFDPIHHGHLIIAQEAQRDLSLDRIDFVPTRVPPHKPPPVAEPEERLTMLDHALDSFPSFRVSRIELDREPPSYTVETLHEYRENRTDDAELYFLAGMDSIKELDQWHRWEELVTLATVVGLKRPEHSRSSVPDPVRDHVRVLESPRVDISSSDIRRRCRDREPYGAFVPRAVREWIEDQNLYRSEDSE